MARGKGRSGEPLRGQGKHFEKCEPGVAPVTTAAKLRVTCVKWFSI